MVFISVINHYRSRGASGGLLLCHNVSDNHLPLGVGGLIGSATTEKAGLFSAADKLKLLTLSITAGSGGTNNWYKICEFAASTYTPIFVKGGAKLYNGSSFIPIGAIANLHDGNLYVANENSNTIAKIGVVKKDGRADLYLKMQGFYGASMLIISPAITQAYCNERGELIVETTEPSGIVYE